MFVLRILGVLVVIATGTSLLMYLFTRDRRYTAFAWQAVRIAMVMAGLVLAFMLLERVLLVL